MINSVKSGTEIQKYQSRHLSSIEHTYNVMVYNSYRGLGGMRLLVSRLMNQKQLKQICMNIEMIYSNSFNKF